MSGAGTTLFTAAGSTTVVITVTAVVQRLLPNAPGAVPPTQGRPIRVVPMRGGGGLVSYEMQLLWSNRAKVCV